MEETPLPPVSSWTFSENDTASRIAQHEKTFRAQTHGLPSEVDVVILGAGYAGLTAARELSREGARVLVLEAHDRAGGRAFNFDLSPQAGYAELGGQWLSPRKQQPHAWSLLVDPRPATH